MHLSFILKASNSSDCIIVNLTFALLMKNRFLLLHLTCLCIASSCSENAPFERATLLDNYANHIIIPALNDLSRSSTSLTGAVAQLDSSKSQEHLSNAQAAWDRTYQAWIKVSHLNFGPGGSEGRRRSILEEVALWPIDLEGIEEKIESAAPDLNDAKRNTRGLLTAGYILFSEGPSNLLAASEVTNRLNYLVLVVKELDQEFKRLQQEWISSYAETFVGNDGTSVKSSTTLMFNEMARSMETLRDLKLGIPMGLIAGQSGPQPDLAEARFSQKSLAYLLLNYEALVSFWRGTRFNGEEGIGFEEYLQSVEGGKTLVDQINAQCQKIDAIVSKVPSNQTLAQLAQNNDPRLTELYQELQGLTRLLKAESSSLLGLAITFSSGDGD